MTSEVGPHNPGGSFETLNFQLDFQIYKYYNCNFEGNWLKFQLNIWNHISKSHVKS